jgi:hypothetical protein
VDKFDENKMYVVEGIAIGYIHRVMDRLYQDHVPFKIDERRDLANGLHAHLNAHVTEWDGKQQAVTTNAEDLIAAAAPEMLAALEEIEAVTQGLRVDAAVSLALENGWQAIRKAKGGK